MEIFRTPDDRFEDLPGFRFEPRYLELRGDLEPLRMAYIEEGAGSPVLLLHGEPTWSYLYRKMIAPLAAAGRRVIAPDLIGFGRSDKPTDRDWYSYDRHVESIVQLVEHLDLKDITVVVQDWGGPIGLRIATEHPDRFRNLVILNTGLFKPSARWPTPAFMQWRIFAEKNPDLPVGFIIQGATVSDLPGEVIRAYEAPWPTPESKAGVAAFPLLVPLDADAPGAKEMAAAGDALKSWGGRCLVAFSDQDPIFSQEAGRRLAEQIPGAVFITLAGGSHFLQEDLGERIAEEIIGFLE